MNKQAWDLVGLMALVFAIGFAVGIGVVHLTHVVM